MSACSTRTASLPLIISGGSNIYPGEIEEVLLQHAGVAEVSVVGEPDREWGEIAVAFVVSTKEACVDEAALDAVCLARLARFKRPKRYVESLPKNNYGKVLKTELRQRLAIAKEGADDGGSVEGQGGDHHRLRLGKSGRGNGKVMAVLFAREGARVFGIDIRGEAACETREIIESEGGTWRTHVADITRPEHVVAATAPASTPSAASSSTTSASPASAARSSSTRGPGTRCCGSI